MNTMNFRRKRTLFGALAGLGLLAFASTAAAGDVKMGVIPGNSLAANNTRDTPWCELGPVVGQPPDMMVHVFNSTNSPVPCTAKVSAGFDLQAIAAEYGLQKVILNPDRFWIADKIMFYQAGEKMEVDGVVLTWAAEMSLADAQRIVQTNPYEYSNITRDTTWYYEKGRPVFLLRQPDGIVWVMQVYSHAVDASLSSANMAGIGDRLNLPEGWTFEVKVLDEPLLIEPARADGDAYIMRDDFRNTYEGCGFDEACSYIP